MHIAAAAHVTLRYAVALDGDPTPDSDADGQVTEFIHGRGQILPGLEAKLAGRDEGERLSFDLSPAEAFGEIDPALELRVPFSDFPDNAREVLKPGMRFRGPHPAEPGRVVLFTVREIAGDEVVATGNHPLAGKSLRVACEVLAVREATEDELSGGGCGSGGCGSGSCGSGSCGEGSCGSGACSESENEEPAAAKQGGCGSGSCGCH
jgi:FKBP-type peptidyl-prolyl cis-trans isomerase SlyD